MSRSDALTQPGGEYPGLYYALVTQNYVEGDDAPDCYRVKVRYPWLPSKDGSEDTSHWAPISVPMAGGADGEGYGTFFAPNVGDQVVVMFVGGDIRFPVILGGIWSQQDLPPEDDSQNKDSTNDCKVIKAGGRLVFDDGDSSKIALTDERDGLQLGCGDFGVTGNGKNKVELSVPGAIEAAADKGVAATARTGDLAIHCPNGTLTLQGGTSVEVTARDSANLHASADGKLSGGNIKICSQGPSRYKGTPIKLN